MRLSSRVKSVPGESWAKPVTASRKKLQCKAHNPCKQKAHLPSQARQAASSYPSRREVIEAGASKSET